MAIYVAGDIQGCFDQLRRLLDKAAFDPSSDQLWSVGDLINRGPKSLETLRFLKALGPAFSGLLGNHDLHFLATACGAYTQGKIKTLRPLLAAPDCDELFEWVRQLPLARRASVPTNAGLIDFLLVHAGIAPSWSFAEAMAYANEVESVLHAPDHREFLRQMYGDKPDTWNPSLRGIDRLRVITNVLTRIRFCTAEGRLDMDTKSDASSAPRGYQPWFEFHAPEPGARILFGHWATIDGFTGKPRIVGLDTGCVWGRRMTMLRLEDETRHSVSCSDV